jgi:hypothetical protein
MYLDNIAKDNAKRIIQEFIKCLSTSLAHLGVVYNTEDHEAERTKFNFVVEDMNKNTADVFRKLQLGQYLPE